MFILGLLAWCLKSLWLVISTMRLSSNPGEGYACFEVPSETPRVNNLLMKTVMTFRSSSIGSLCASRPEEPAYMTRLEGNP
ncbi:hypothetical protein B0J15DRAFT_146646 [Fusarium solani]|uniref:Secreted protein n=1 Tax=Fusarium solani TaxID=169388 RepID=A0A9P9GG49_FUSSL|nr:uncharacterized protein B0J15DRAFT_146646 [Fusarium solani]KAH7237369.1 hypothetical protein B0J15DRAFT_146646 [Fusarium solani]